MRIMVLGATGLLGCALVPHLRGQGHEVLAHGHTGAAQSAADLTQQAQAQEAIAAARPEVVVNLVGLTDVDACQAQPQRAWLLNVRTAENVAAACADAGAALLHISTDQVYDGTGPHREEGALPGNSYALTKYAGELAALRAQATVLRTNFFGASRHARRRSLTDWLAEGLRQGRTLPVFDDVLFSPLSMATLCEAIARLAVLRPAGVFNLGAREGMSKAAFAQAFAQAAGLDRTLLAPCSVDTAELKAWRPRDMRLHNARIEAILDRPMPTLADEILLAAKDYRGPR